jgi:hypothetical protein
MLVKKMYKRGVDSSVLHNCGESVVSYIFLNVFDYTIIE